MGVAYAGPMKMQKETVGSSDAQTVATSVDKRVAAGGVLVYLGLIGLFSLPLYFLLNGTELPVEQQPLLITLLMWMPALAALGARLIRREGFRDGGLSTLGRDVAGPIAVALMLPVVVGVLSYGAAWSLGVATFAAPQGSPGGVISLGGGIVRALLIGAPLGIIMVAGEEIGWRGYMSDRLRRAGVPFHGFVGGVIWASWHAPLIVTGQYAGGPHPLLSVVGFAILAVALHLLWSNWKARTGSLWPAILGHSAWNVVIQHPFDGHTIGNAASIWVGDSGLLTSGMCLVVVFLLLGGRGRGAASSV